jgi:hypothetical protein
MTELLSCGGLGLLLLLLLLIFQESSSIRYLFVDERSSFSVYVALYLFVKMSVINYISTRSLRIILAKSSQMDRNETLLSMLLKKIF